MTHRGPAVVDTLHELRMASGWAKGETEDGPRKEMDTWVGVRMTER